MRMVYTSNYDGAKREFSPVALSGHKIRLLMRLICLDMEATEIAQLTGLNRNPVNPYLRHFRECIATLCEAELPLRGPVSGWIQFNRVCLTALTVTLAAFGSGAAFGQDSAPPLPVIAVTDSSDDGHAASNAVDGSLATRWSANGNGQWLQLDLGTSQQIGSVYIAWYEGNQRKAKFDLQTGNDGINWTTIYTGESSGTTTNYESYPVVTSSGRYLRVVGHGNTSDLWNSISDVQMFGSSAAGTPAGLRFLVNPAGPVLSGILNGSTVTLNWNFPAGTMNQVQVSSNLVSWQNVGAPITHSTAVQTWVEDASSFSPAAWPARFYRLKPATDSSGSPPTAKFTVSSTFGIAPLAVHFTDQSMGHPSAWSWDFGDNTTSTVQNPRHIYMVPATYAVTLTVQNSAGESSSKGTTIQVNPQPSNWALPSQVLDLMNWKLTLPIGSSGSPTEITQPALASFRDPNYFYVNDAGYGVVFTAPCGGVTTSHSGYPRSELREMTSNGSSSASWSTTSGISTMEVTEAFTHLPVAKPHAIAGQIHDGVTKVIDCRLEGHKLYMEDAHGGTIVVLTQRYQLGTRFRFMWVVQNGGIDIYYNGQYITTYPVTDSGCYFKVGDYTQSNPSRGDAAAAYSQVVVFRAIVTHQ